MRTISETGQKHEVVKFKKTERYLGPKEEVRKGLLKLDWYTEARKGVVIW